MALYYNGDYVSSINFTPQMTLAEYNALEIKPKYWIRTDAPENSGINADDVIYDENNSVKDAIDDLNTNLSDKYLIIEGGYVSDADIPFSSLPKTGILKNYTDNNTAHKAITGTAMLFTINNSKTAGWGIQISLSDGGFFARVIQNSVYGTWIKINNDLTQIIYTPTVNYYNGYIRGVYSSTQTTSIQTRITDVLNQIDPTCGSSNIGSSIFDILIISNGTFHFHGYLYANKLYGAGILEWYGGVPVLWRRNNGTDTFNNITIS